MKITLMYQNKTIFVQDENTYNAGFSLLLTPNYFLFRNINGQMIDYECSQEILMIKIFLLEISNLFFCTYGPNT